MGDTTKSSGSSTTQQSGSQQYTPTAEETAYNKLKLGTATELEPQLKDVQSQGLTLSSSLLRGQSLPGYLEKLPGGISPDVTQSIVNQSLKDIQPHFQRNGLLNSGVNAMISARTSADIRNQAEQYNINNLNQLLNLGLGGQAQVQAPIEGFSSQLSGRLAGLRSSSFTGNSMVNSNSTVTAMNPFLKSFQTSFGSSLGEGWGKNFSCLIATEVFGSFWNPKTIAVREFLVFKAPRWVLRMYQRHSVAAVKFLKKHPFVKLLITPLFEAVARLGGYRGK